jgi:nicotinamidase-related amidase
MTTALIVIDVQESFRRRPAWAQVSNPRIVDDVNRLVDAARSAGHEVVWVLHSEPGSGTVFDPASQFVRLMDGLVPAPGEFAVTKTSVNAFTTTNLGQHLTAAGVTRLVIAGIQTEQCCETTARLAADFGYEVVFVTEATATFPITRPDTGAVLGTDEVITRTEFALAGRFARISTIENAFAPARLPVPAHGQ